MKKLRIILIAALFFISAGAFAQNNMEDVVYLKNGSIYRGLIVEQILGESIKIKIVGGSVISFPVADVYKITKEPTQAEPVKKEPRQEYEHGMGFGFHHFGSDSTRLPAYKKNKRFFGTIEFRPGLNNIGLRVVRGYKFNRMAQFGLGIGVDGVYFGKGISFGKGVYDNTNVNNGLYIPLYFQLSGELLKRKVTPYYYAEAGYAFHPANPFANKNLVSKSWGGPVGALGLGIKFHSRGRSSFAVNINANYRSDIYRTKVTTFDPFGNAIVTEQNGFKGKVFGTLGFAIGF
jgi:hypothetical protein